MKPLGPFINSDLLRGESVAHKILQTGFLAESTKNAYAFKNAYFLCVALSVFHWINSTGQHCQSNVSFIQQLVHANSRFSVSLSIYSGFYFLCSQNYFIDALSLVHVATMKRKQHGQWCCTDSQPINSLDERSVGWAGCCNCFWYYR